MIFITCIWKIKLACITYSYLINDMYLNLYVECIITISSKSKQLQKWVGRNPKHVSEFVYFDFYQIIFVKPRICKHLFVEIRNE